MSWTGSCSWSCCRERSPVYRGRSANTVIRMRGYLLAAFEDAGLPEEALPYVFEELESGRARLLGCRSREGPSRPGVPQLPTPCRSCSRR